jgi:hypothetical protein
MRSSYAEGKNILAGCLVALAVSLALAPASASAARTAPDPAELRLRAGSFDPLHDPLPSQALPIRRRYPPGVRGGYLVQFERPITQSDREALERLGAVVGGSVPVRALEVVMSESVRPRVEGLAGVRWVGPYQGSWKAAPDLLAAPARSATAKLALRVSLFAGAGDEGLDALRALGARVLNHQTARSFSVADVEIPAARLRALAELPLVRHVNVTPTAIFHNDRARFLTGLAALADDTFSSGLDPSLDGRDESSGFQLKYGHTDAGLWPGHPDFQAAILDGRMTFEPGADTDDPTGHGTHTAGSLVGDGGDWTTIPHVPPGSGATSAARWRGIQPEAALHHISMDNAYTDREMFERHAEEGAQILTNSWGYADCTSGCTTITDYDASAALWDEGVWDADDDEAGLQPVVALFAAGNGAFAQLNGCPLFGGSDQISSPGTAKNVITIGASETDRGCGLGEGNHPGDVLFVSSRGPVDPDLTGQGLYKPDLTAVGGAFLLSAEREGTGGVPSSFDDPTYCADSGTSYRYEGGSSMACPIAAGVSGVLFQDLVVRLGVAAPKPSLIKALLVNGAEAIEPSGPCDYDFETDASVVHRGWGLVRADRSLYGAEGTPELRDVGFENEVTAHALATGETHQVDVEVAPGAPFKVTLAWTDHPATPGAGSPLVVNDLDLEVVGPEGTFLGNDFVGDWSVASGSTPDRYNVVENVYVESPLGGTYTITVRAHQVSQDQEPDAAGVNQDFSLVWSTPTVDRAVPEPSQLLLLGASLAFLATAGRRRMKS